MLPVDLYTIVSRAYGRMSGQEAADSGRAILRDLLLKDYNDLTGRLTRKLGSPDLASEVLHETFLRLESAGHIGPMQSPRAYLFRMALNIATDRRRSENRRLTVGEADALLDIADDAPSPAQIIEDRSEIAALKHAIAEMPPRRREIFMAARMESQPHKDIAARFGVGVRTIEIELKHALEHCALRLSRNLHSRFGRRPRETSSE
jgi:RNA polymerase sigma factor (sigma-70 family)